MDDSIVSNMSHVWTFSASSEHLLKLCIDAAAPQTEGNKWLRAFKRKPSNLDEPPQNNDVKLKKFKKDIIRSKKIPREEKKSLIIPSELDDEFLDMIETENVLRFELLIEKSLENPKILTELAHRLSGGAIEKICYHLFSTNDINKEFLDNFFKYFFPRYFKREYNWLSLDLLVKAKPHSERLKQLLQTIFKDVEVSCKLLQEYVLVLNDTEKLEFLLNISELDLSTEEFVHNLTTISIVYKDSKKLDSLQNFIQRYIIKCHSNCTADKSFGRLLLLFLQAQNNNARYINDCTTMEKVVESHRTAFKKPCMTALKENLKIKQQ